MLGDDWANEGRGFQKWGQYDGRTIEVSWDDAKIVAAGIDAPRVTD